MTLTSLFPKPFFFYSNFWNFHNLIEELINSSIGYSVHREIYLLGVHHNAKETLSTATPRSHAPWALLRAATSACPPRRCKVRLEGMKESNAQETSLLGVPICLSFARRVLGVHGDA